MSKNERSLEERAELFIAQHQSRYSEAITNARSAAETTATPAWQHRFAACMKEHKAVIDQKMRAIAASLDIMRTEDTCEETEKDIRDSVKAIAEERIRHTAWWNRAVAPYREAAELCGKLYYGTVHAAEQSEQSAPLVDRGLGEAVRKLVQKWPTAKWDNDAGTVIVIEGGKAQPEADAEAA